MTDCAASRRARDGSGDRFASQWAGLAELRWSVSNRVADFTNGFQTRRLINDGAERDHAVGRAVDAADPLTGRVELYGNSPERVVSRFECANVGNPLGAVRIR